MGLLLTFGFRKHEKSTFIYYHEQHHRVHLDHLNGFALLARAVQSKTKIILNYLFDMHSIYANSIILCNKTPQVCTLQDLGADTGVDSFSFNLEYTESVVTFIRHEVMKIKCHAGIYSPKFWGYMRTFLVTKGPVLLRPDSLLSH